MAKRNRYLIVTKSINGKWLAYVFAGKGDSVYHCNTKRALDKRRAEAEGYQSIQYFPNITLAHKYCEETTEYLNS